MDKLRLLVSRWTAWTARPMDESTWLRRRNRIVTGALVIAAMLAVQTAMVHSPDYMINGLYHNRRIDNLQMHAMPEAARAKLLERLCLTSSLLEHGGGDPYKIPGARECYEKYRAKLD
jgi:hypothetical protein